MQRTRAKIGIFLLVRWVVLQFGALFPLQTAFESGFMRDRPSTMLSTVVVAPDRFPEYRETIAIRAS